MKRASFFTVLLCFFLATGSLHAAELPKIQGRVTDYAKVLSSEEVSKLEQKLESHEQQTSNQIAIVLIKSLEERVLEELSLAIAEDFGLGREEKDNGLLILVAIEDRKLRIETGYGFEGVLPDGMCGRIIRNDITPHFKKTKYYQGLDNGLDKIFLAVKGEYVGEEESSKASKGTAFLVLLAIIFLVAGFAGHAHRVVGGFVGALGAFIVVMLLYSSLLWAGILAVVAFFIGLVARDILGAVAEGSSSVGWSSGGYSSGSSGGGSSFGGFGGGFGGGGASGSW